MLVLNNASKGVLLNDFALKNFAADGDIFVFTVV